MTKSNNVGITALIVALGGLLMGFDASVISGVIKFIEPEFGLTKLQLGWSVSSLTLTATLAMMLAGPLSDRYGRRLILMYAAILYAISALASAFAPTFWFLVVARMVGGFGVGASLILAPMYIAEIAPASVRGRMVSFNQLNIVIGISLAFFTNYLILQYGASDAALVKSLGLDQHQWRWMLGLETIPAVCYFVGLFFVPKSPRWLIMKGQIDQAKEIMRRFGSDESVEQDVAAIQKSIDSESSKKRQSVVELFDPSLRLVLTIGVVVAVLQQITGINSVFFYAPMIFEQSGIGTDAAFIQAILVGLVNLGFTVIAILFIDKLGRKPLLIGGVGGIVVCMFTLAYGFNSATYTLNDTTVLASIDSQDQEKLSGLIGVTFDDDTSYKQALSEVLGAEKAKIHESTLINSAITMNPTLILAGILGFVASFAISIGPVMWVLFSELFPNWIRGLAISFVGLINSAVSFIVQLVFPWELEVLGSATTFLIYGVFALLGLLFIIKIVPETKGKSLEELEQMLVKK